MPTLRRASSTSDLSRDEEFRSRSRGRNGIDVNDAGGIIVRRRCGLVESKNASG